MQTVPPEKAHSNVKSWLTISIILMFGLMFLNGATFILFPIKDFNAFGLLRILLFPVSFVFIFGASLMLVVLSLRDKQGATAPSGVTSHSPNGIANATLTVASSTGQAQERAARAAEGANIRKPYSVMPFNWVIIALVVLTMVMFFVDERIAAPMFLGIFIWITVRHFKSNSQLLKYKKAYKANGVDYSDIINERTYGSEVLRGRSLMNTGGTSDVWNARMWDKYGQALMWREHVLKNIADENNVPFQPVVPETPDEHIINPAFRSHTNTALWQVRNMFTLPDEEDNKYPVQFADMNNILEAKVNKRPNPALLVSSYMETWFPADYVLVVYPNRLTGYTEWRNIGEPLELGEPAFKKMFDARTDNPTWARLVLNPSVMEKLMQLSPVVLLIDNGRITLGRQNKWIEPEEIQPFVDMIRRIAQSAKAAEY